MTDPAPVNDFRDTLATIDQSGRRIWVYPQQPSGPFYRWRTILAAFLIAFYAIAPFVKVNGNPLMLFDIFTRHFSIFGIAVFPHDFHLLVLAVICFGVFVILFTAAFGRLFCGWACPQTVFLEMVFRRIEFWIEGDGPKQRKRDRGAHGGSWFWRKAAKYTIYLLLSFGLGNILLAYFVGSERLMEFISQSPAEHPGGFIFVTIFTLVTFGVFARFREQVCTLVCPYGRLQSVLLDTNSIVVAYDTPRGEPRAKASRQRAEDAGDCVDCAQCVAVCPTGIDIRNGTQLECVNCTACIDACNRVMKRIGSAPNLIKYASFDQIVHGRKFRLTGRLIGYAAALLVLVGVVGLLAGGRSKVETTILRATGSLYEETDAGLIRNLYTVKVLNKSSDSLEIVLRLKHPEGDLRLLGPRLAARPQQNVESVFVVEIEPERLFSSTTSLVIEACQGEEVLEEIYTSFSGPE